MVENDVYSEKNLGLPVKVEMGKDKNGKIIYMYGRYYGRGYDGESTIQDDDYNLLAMVTPGNTLVRGGSINFYLIESEEDLNILNKYESLTDFSYSDYLDRDENGNFYKTYKYKNNPISLKDYPKKWFEKRGLFEIDEELFANALSYLLSLKLNKKLYYQKLEAICGANPGPIWQKCEDSRKICVISSKKYEKNYSTYTSNHPYSQKDYFDTIFKKFPVSVNDGDYLIYFGYYFDRKVILGTVEDGIFIPKDFDPIHDVCHDDEIMFNNPKYPFISQFIKEIIDYKLLTGKFNINQEDMNIILKLFINKENNMLYVDKKKEIKEYNNIKKYIGLIKIYEENMIGTSVRILSRTFDDKDNPLIKKWFSLYPNAKQHILLRNTRELNDMFEIFEDSIPLTKDEEQEHEQAKMLYKNLFQKTTKI